MAVDRAGSSGRRRSGLLDALFGEAWDLERRRRRRWWLLLLLACCIAAAAALFAAHPGGIGTRGGTPTGGRVIVSSHRLPLTADYTGLSVAGGRLRLIDYGNFGPPGTDVPCRVATVDPRSLTLSSAGRGSCDNPALFGEHVMEVRQPAVRDGNTLAVRVATVSRRARSGYRLGPVLFSYDQCSDCWDESIYGRHSLWIYAPISTTGGYRAGGELFRISEQTGRLLQRWRMPSMVRSLLAVDADGLWIAPSIDTGNPSGLYHVAPGMRHPQRVLTIRDDARFLVATGHTVWFETWLATPDSIPRLYRLRGTRLTTRGLSVRGRTPCTDMGEGPATVLGGSAGIYCVQIGSWTSLGVTSQTVSRLVPDQLDQRAVATVTPPPGTFDSQAAAYLNGSYYFLDQSTQTTGVASGSWTGRTARPTDHAGVIFRVTPA